MFLPSMSQLSTYHWTLERDLEEFVQFGFPALGAWRKKLDDYGEADSIELIQSAPLRVSSLQWAGGFTGSDGRSHEESIEDGLLAVRLAVQIGAEALVLITGGRGGHTQSHALRLTRVAIETLRGLAREYAIRLVIEPMHAAGSSEWTYLNSIPATLELLDSLDPPRDDLGILFDTFHLLEPGMEIDFPREWVERIGLVQIGDRIDTPAYGHQRLLPGKGRLPIGPFLRWLEKGGYAGYTEFEVFGDQSEDLGYTELLKLCRGFTW